MSIKSPKNLFFMQNATNNIMVIFLIVMSLNKLVAYAGLQIII